MKQMLQRLSTFIERRAGKLFIIWIIALSLLYATLSVQRHNQFQSGAFDLGIFDQAVWQYAHFQYPYNTIKERLILGDHLNLTLPLLAPLYWVWGDVRILLIFQAVWISLSAIAVYKLTLVRGFSKFVAMGVGIIYSLFFGIQYAVFFDFHPIVIAVGLLAWLIYFFEAKKKKLFWVTLVLALLTQENVGIALAGIGLVYFFKKEYRLSSVLFMIGGMGVSLLQTKLVSLMSPVGYQYWPQFDNNLIAIFIRFFDTHEKRLVWLYSLSSFLFLPLLSIGSFLAVAFDLSQYFLPTNDYTHMRTPFLHHRAILAIFLTLGTLDALLTFKKIKLNPQLVMVFLLTGCLVTQYVFHFPLNKLAKRSYWQNEQWMKDNYEIIKEIPIDASLATQQSLVPHLSQRKEIYLVWPRKHAVKGVACPEKECWWLDFAGKPTYLLIDNHPGVWLTMTLESEAHINEAVENMERAQKIKLEKSVHDARLYKVIY
jgi:uncharacterized membrane protein